MKLAIFDLDNTLIAGDSDCLWGEYLSEHGYVDPTLHKEKHEKFYLDYISGKLDIYAFLKFQLQALVGHEQKTLHTRRDIYIKEKIKPVILKKAQETVENHRRLKHELIIITATNHFLTQPIANIFNINNLIACEPEIKNGKYTGNIVGTPSYAKGKIIRLNEWLQEKNTKLTESWFYTDSHNDLPLLKIVDHAIAVDPDEHLRKKAQELNWKIVSFR